MERRRRPADSVSVSIRTNVAASSRTKLVVTIAPKAPRVTPSLRPLSFFPFLSHGRLDRRLVGPGVFREEGMFGIGNLRLDDLHVACNMFHLIFKMTASDRIRESAGGNGSQRREWEGVH